jgi:hypothetical protein
MTGVTLGCDNLCSRDSHKLYSKLGGKERVNTIPKRGEGIERTFFATLNSPFAVI